MDVQTQIYTVLQDCIALAITIIGGFVIQYIRKHLNAKQLGTAKGITKVVVAAAQEIGKSLGLTGPQKLDAAIAKAQALAAKAGIKLTTEQWDALIHSELAKLKKIWDSVEQVPTAGSTPEPAQEAPKEQAPAVAAAPLPGKWVLGKGFICNFPVSEQKTQYQLFTTGTIGTEEFEKMKSKVEGYSKKTDLALTDFIASINIQ